MKKSKLLDVFRSLEGNQIRLLGEFLDSPYHNKNQLACKLFKYLERCYPDFKDKKIERKLVFSKIFPKEPYNDLKMRHLFSLLLKCTEEFLIAEAQKEDPTLSNILLLQEYRKLKLQKHFSATLRKISDLRKKNNKKGIQYFYHSYRIEQEVELIDSLFQERRNETNLQNVSDQLDAFYVTSKLKQICEIVSYQHLFNQEYELKMMQEILDHLEENHYQNPVINIYYYGFLTLKEPENRNHFLHLKKELIQHQHELSRDELADAHALARNSVIRRMNLGAKVYQELLDLYKLGLEVGILLDEKGEMSPASFKNIVAVGLRVKEFDWVKSFIESHSKKINTQERDSYRKYGMARWHFANGDYEEVIFLLNQINYADIFMMLDSKVVLMQTYYESEEFDALESLLESFNQLLIRKKILGYHKDNYRNTSKFIRQLMNLNGYDRQAKNLMQKKIKETKAVSIREWLLSKLV